MRKRKDIKGKYAIVTGASSGLGLAISADLASRGCKLLMVSNQEKELDTAKEELITRYKTEAQTYCIDLTCSNAADMLYDFCQEQNIQPFIIVNNAGIFPFKDFARNTSADIDRIIALHVATPSQIIHKFAPEMIPTGGYILNTCSLAGKLAFPSIATYCATKAYLRALTRSLWYEYKSHGVVVTALSPGAVATSLYNLPPKYIKLGMRIGVIKSTQETAHIAINALLKGKQEVVPSRYLNGLLGWLVNALPKRCISYIYKKIEKYQIL